MDGVCTRVRTASGMPWLVEGEVALSSKSPLLEYIANVHFPLVLSFLSSRYSNSPRIVLGELLVCLASKSGLGRFPVPHSARYESTLWVNVSLSILKEGNIAMFYTFCRGDNGIVCWLSVASVVITRRFEGGAKQTVQTHVLSPTVRVMT
jgi:hypothetical protein